MHRSLCETCGDPCNRKRKDGYCSELCSRGEHNHKVACPECEEKYTRYRGAITKHLIRKHGYTQKETANILGKLCKHCCVKLAREGSDYCSTACGKKAGGIKISNKRNTESQAKVQKRIEAFKNTLEQKYDRGVTESSLQTELESMGFSLLKYNGSVSTSKLSCLDGHTFYRRATDLRKFSECPVCIRNTKMANAKNYVNKVGFEWISGDLSSMNLFCKKGHQVKRSFYSVQTDDSCPECNTLSKTKEYKKYFEKYNLKLIEFNGWRKQSTFECKNKHKYNRLFTLAYYDPRCIICSMLKYRYSLNRLYNRLSELGYSTDCLPAHDYWGFIDRSTPVRIRCDQGHVYETPCVYVLREKRLCPKCNMSKEEYHVGEELEAADLKIRRCDRKIIYPKELDIVSDDHHIAIEVCGLYWHSDAIQPDPYYHRDKMKKCKELGYRLFTLFADEWHRNKNACLSRILNACGKNKTVGARECYVKPITSRDANTFFEESHLQGRPNNMKAAWGLIHKNELVSCLCVGALTRSHTGSKKVLELKRMATKPYLNIPGGFSKMLKRAVQWAIDSDYTEIRSYCDLRWGTGDVYRKSGFSLIRTGGPTYWYTDGVARYSAFSKRRTEEERAAGVTEWEARAAQGYHRIWDCGHQTWSLSLEHLM